VKIQFITPYESFDDPSEDILREVLVEHVEEYLGSRPSDAGLHYVGGGPRSQLIVMYMVGRGHYIAYQQAGMGSEEELQTDGGADDPVSMSVGGEPFEASSRAFVPADVAWQVIKAFVDSGAQMPAPSGFAWVRTGRV